MFKAGLLADGDRVIFTSGDHMEHHGATNTLRLLQVGEDGKAEGLGELVETCERARAYCPLPHAGEGRGLRVLLI